MLRKQTRRNLFIGQYVLVTIVAVTLLSLTAYLIYRGAISERKIFHLHFFALALGLVFEFRRLTDKWKTVLWTLFGSFLLSFFAFAPGKRERNYVFEEHLQQWPYYFLAFFVLIALVVSFTDAIHRLTEGITLLLTVAINYWLFANGYWQDGSWWVKALIALNALASLYALIHAFTYTSLTKGNRVLLSLWTSIIALILSINNIIQTFAVSDIETLPTVTDSIFAFLQFFLLGASAIYIVQNFLLVAAYLPGKNFVSSVQEMNDVHLDRFSGEQVYVFESIVAFVVSCSLFILNYYYQWLPINFMIWLVLIIVPFLLRVILKFFG